MDWRERVRQLMAENSIRTVTELAGKTGISAGSLGTAMRGNHDLKPATFEKLATALGSTSRWLMYGDNTIEVWMVPVLEQAETVYIFQRDGAAAISDAPQDTIRISGRQAPGEDWFGWVNHQKDMAPVFNYGDILVVEPNDDLEEPRQEAPLYVMLGWRRYQVSPDKVRYVSDYDSVFVGEALLSAKGLVVVSADRHSEYVLRNTSGEFDPNISLIGKIVQRITLYQ